MSIRERVTMEVIQGGYVVTNEDIIEDVEEGIMDGGFAWNK